MLLCVSDLILVFILSLMCNSGHVAWLYRINSSSWKLIKINRSLTRVATAEQFLDMFVTILSGN